MSDKTRRVKYRPDHHPHIIKWMARSGKSNDQIAKEIGIASSTMSRWKYNYPEVAEALKNSRAMVDHLVEDGLLKRALGYTVEESKSKVNAQGQVIGIEVTEKKIAPDVIACIFWLKNRNPAMWKAEGNETPPPDPDTTASDVIPPKPHKFDQNKYLELFKQVQAGNTPAHVKAKRDDTGRPIDRDEQRADGRNLREEQEVHTD